MAGKTQQEIWERLLYCLEADRQAAMRKMAVGELPGKKIPPSDSSDSSIR